MVIVFSVNGSLATYFIEYKSASHVIAKRSGNEEGRQDIPEEIDFFCEKGIWNSDAPSDNVKIPILKALNNSKPGDTYLK